MGFFMLVSLTRGTARTSPNREHALNEDDTNMGYTLIVDEPNPGHSLNEDETNMGYTLNQDDPDLEYTLHGAEPTYGHIRTPNGY